MRNKQIMTVVYAVTAAAVGVWRHLQTGESPQAMWFGIVMGAVALLGALLLSLRNRIAGYVLIAISLSFVVGWFLKRMLSGHSDGTSVRVILILVVSAIEIGVLLRRCPRAGAG